MDNYTIKPVGVVKSVLKEPALIEESGDLLFRPVDENAKKKEEKISELVSEIVIDDSYSGIVDGIEDFSHVLVLYWAHKTSEEARSLTKVHPMGRKDFPLVGIFATCSPVRPNPILVTAVKLLERNGNTLRVQGLEAIDGSPVIDIKPYNPHYYLVKNIRISWWMKEIQREFARKSSVSSPSQSPV